MYHMGARWYAPQVGRFTQRDPIMADVLQSEMLNKYIYAVNNPVLFTDPRGLFISLGPNVPPGYEQNVKTAYNLLWGFAQSSSDPCTQAFEKGCCKKYKSGALHDILYSNVTVDNMNKNTNIPQVHQAFYGATSFCAYQNVIYIREDQMTNPRLAYFALLKGLAQHCGASSSSRNNIVKVCGGLVF
jgi:hypothetical protein